MARNRYEQLIERIFLAHYKRGSTQVTFDRDEIPKMANRLGIEIPKNLGDLIYSFRCLAMNKRFLQRFGTIG